MMWGIVLATIAIVLAIDSLVILIFKNWTIKVLKMWIRKPEALLKVAMVEAIVAIVLFVVSWYFGFY